MHNRQSTLPHRLLYCAILLTVYLPSLAQDSDMLPISLGQPQVVELVPGGVQLVYEADDEQVVTVAARSLEPSGVIDTTLEILGVDGRRVEDGFNDDHQSERDGFAERDSLIENLTLPVAGAYTIRLNSFNGVDTGQVEIVVEAGDLFNAVVTEESGTTVVHASLPPNRRYRYTFTAEAGDTLSLTARDTSGTLDPLLMLRDDDGNIVARNDDHSANSDLSLDLLDAEIRDFEILADGQYTIEVSDFTGTAGTFELRITRQ